jgi:hypothetical protein
MDWREFCYCVAAGKFKLSELRCDTPPCPKLIELMDTVGLDKYERFVRRFELELRKEPNANADLLRV